MRPVPDLDPVLFTIGAVEVRWYGLAYLLGFAATYVLLRVQARRVRWQWMLDRWDMILLVLIIGLVLGARLGYVVLYDARYYFAHPMEILSPWRGGLSFHGGTLGVLLAGVLLGRRLDPSGQAFARGADLVVVTTPIGLGLGRLGNFINGELYGRITDVPWGMVFPMGGPLPRHPSQLYEAILEGPVLFALLWSLRHKPWQGPPDPRWPHGSLLALFLVSYGALRWGVEFTREPDPQLGLILLGMSMGQLLSIGMVGGGILLYAHWRRAAQPGEP